MSDSPIHDGFRVERADQGNAIVLCLIGEADLSTVETVRAALLETLSEPGALVILDLSRLTFVDSTSLSVWINARQLALSSNSELRIAAPVGLVSEVLTVAGLKELFLITPTVEEALDLPSSTTDN